MRRVPADARFADGFRHAMLRGAANQIAALDRLCWVQHSRNGLTRQRCVRSGQHVDRQLAELDAAFFHLYGIERDDVDVEITGDTISIRGEKTDEKDETRDEEGREFRRIERRAGSFKRMTRLPFEIDPEKVVARIRKAL